MIINYYVLKIAVLTKRIYCVECSHLSNVYFYLQFLVQMINNINNYDWSIKCIFKIVRTIINRHETIIISNSALYAYDCLQICCIVFQKFIGWWERRWLKLIENGEIWIKVFSKGFYKHVITPSRVSSRPVTKKYRAASHIVLVIIFTRRSWVSPII